MIQSQAVNELMENWQLGENFIVRRPEYATLDERNEQNTFN